MRLILVRHGETPWNQERRVQGGLSDIELSQTGKAQAESLSSALTREKITAVYSSPLKRASVTAEAIARPHSLQVICLPELSEIDAGEMEGVVLTEARGRLEAIMAESSRDGSYLSLPGGESMLELQGRAWAAIERIASAHPRDTVVVVSHYFVTQAIICRALGLPLSNARRLRLNIAAITTLRLNEGAPCLVTFNDTCHLTQDPGPS